MSQTIQNKVHAVGRRARTLVLLHGLCYFVGAVLTAGLLLGIADYVVRFRDPGVRIICSTALLLALVWSFHQYVLSALRRRFREVVIAQRIERRFPQLGDRLSSALEFLQSPRDTADSPELRKAVIAETERAVSDLNLFECLDGHATRRAVAFGTPLVLILATICLLDFDSTSRAAQRLVAPWNENAWPRWNNLEFTTKPARIAVGQDFEVALIDRNGRLPQQVAIEYWFDGDSESKIESRIMGRVDQQMLHRRANVTRPFKYRAVGGDDDTMEWIPLEVVEPVGVEGFAINIQPPAYSGIAASRLAGGSIRMLAGSTIEVSGRARRRVETAAIQIELGGEVTFHAATLSADGQEFVVSNLPTDVAGDGQYWLEFVEADGVISGRETRGVWQVSTDERPQVTMLRPDATAYFAAQAAIPLYVRAVDDLSVRTIELRHGDELISLFERTSESLTALPANKDVREASYTWDVAPLNLRPGDVLEFHVVASDFNAQESEIVTRSLSIISQEEFDARFQERQRALSQRLTQALRVQRSTRNQVDSVQLRITQSNQLAEDDRVLLQGCELQQQQVARLLGDNPEGTRALIAELSAMLMNNRVDRPDVARQLASFDEELETLCERMLPEIRRGLRQATRAVGNAPRDQTSMGPLLMDVRLRQAEVIESLQKMLERSGALGDYRRFAHEFAGLLREQRDLTREANQLQTLGRRLDELSEEETTEIWRLSQQQLELARRHDRLRGEMELLRGQLQNEEPVPAATLADAIRVADDRGVSERMRASSTNLARNQLGNANDALREAEDGLKAVLDALANRGAVDTARRIRELQRTAAELQELRRRQHEVRQELERYAQQPDALRNSETARRQRAIATESERAAQRLQRLRSEGAGSLAEAAARAAFDAAEASENGDASSAGSAATTAEEQLQEAQRRLAEEIQQAEQDLLARQLLALKQQVTELADRQRALLEAVSSLRTDFGEAQRRAILPGLTAQQSQLAADTAQTRERLAPPRAFDWGLSLAERRMREAETRLKQGRVDAETERWQAEALARLEQLLVAIRSETDPPNGNDADDGDTSESPDGERPAYSLAELRLLHLMQLEIHERTVTLERLQKPDGTFDESSQRELQQLTDEQATLAELVKQMISQNDTDAGSSKPQDVDAELDRALEEAGIPGFGDNCQGQDAPDVDLDRLLEGVETDRKQPELRQAEGEDLGEPQRDPLVDIGKRMQAASERMSRKDTSTATQNLQMSIARDLGELIKQAESRSARRNAVPRPANRSSTEAGEASSNGDLPDVTASDDERRKNLIDAVWGRLPERLRQQIQSPLQEEFLPRYERVIEDYYKRLSEEQTRLRN
jgi:hypothetical protein